MWVILALVVVLFAGCGDGSGGVAAGKASLPQSDTISFATKENTPRSTVIESEESMLHGTNYAVTICVDNGEWAIGGPATTGGTVWHDKCGPTMPGDILKVRHTSSSQPLTSTVTTIHLDSFTTTFTSITGN